MKYWAQAGWLLLAAGCSTVTGLDDIQEHSCAPNCADSSTPKGTDGASESGATDTGVAEAGPSPLDGSGNDTSPGPGADASADTSTDGTTGSDVAVDATEDGSPDGGPGIDAPVDVSSDRPMEPDSCGPTNTVQNCGACGQSCAATTAATTAASCSGLACTYTCGTDTAKGADGGTASVPAYLDCNASVGYDPDGCECSATQTNMPIACCGTSCPVQHNDGLSGGSFPTEIYFYDCNPVGTYTQAAAMEACTNFEGGPANALNCYTSTCGSGSAVCGDDGTICPCWQYSGTGAGQVDPGTLDLCTCPSDSTGSTTTWQ